MRKSETISLIFYFLVDLTLIYRSNTFSRLSVLLLRFFISFWLTLDSQIWHSLLLFIWAYSKTNQRGKDSLCQKGAQISVNIKFYTSLSRVSFANQSINEMTKKYNSYNSQHWHLCNKNIRKESLDTESKL